jgi:hypothetical protein
MDSSKMDKHPHMKTQQTNKQKQGIPAQLFFVKAAIAVWANFFLVRILQIPDV